METVEFSMVLVNLLVSAAVLYLVVKDEALQPSQGVTPRQSPPKRKGEKLKPRWNSDEKEYLAERERMRTEAHT